MSSDAKVNSSILLLGNFLSFFSVICVELDVMLCCAGTVRQIDMRDWTTYQPCCTAEPHNFFTHPSPCFFALAADLGCRKWYGMLVMFLTGRKLPKNEGPKTLEMSRQQKKLPSNRIELLTFASLSIAIWLY